MLSTVKHFITHSCIKNLLHYSYVWLLQISSTTWQKEITHNRRTRRNRRRSLLNNIHTYGTRRQQLTKRTEETKEGSSEKKVVPTTPHLSWGVVLQYWQYILSRYAPVRIVQIGVTHLSKKNTLSRKKRRRIMCAFKLRKRKHTPLPGNMCQRCGGTVVKKLASLLRGKFYFSTPECNSCGRVYIYAENVQTVGEAEFQNLLNKPFTVK